MPTYYEELKAKQINTDNLPLILAFTVPYIIKVDAEIGTLINTFAKVETYNN